MVNKKQHLPSQSLTMGQTSLKYWPPGILINVNFYWLSTPCKGMWQWPRQGLLSWCESEPGTWCRPAWESHSKIPHKSWCLYIITKKMDIFKLRPTMSLLFTLKYTCLVGHRSAGILQSPGRGHWSEQHYDHWVPMWRKGGDDPAVTAGDKGSGAGYRCQES